MILSTLTKLPDGDIIELDCAFDYQMWTPSARVSIKPTSKGYFRQRSLPIDRVLGESKFEFQFSEPTLLKQIQEWGREGCLLRFTGHSGEVWQVDITNLQPSREAAFYLLSGTFRIYCEESPMCPGFECEEDPLIIVNDLDNNNIIENTE